LERASEECRQQEGNCARQPRVSLKRSRSALGVKVDATSPLFFAFATTKVQLNSTLTFQKCFPLKTMYDKFEKLTRLQLKVEITIIKFLLVNKNSSKLNSSTLKLLIIKLIR